MDRGVVKNHLLFNLYGFFTIAAFLVAALLSCRLLLPWVTGKNSFGAAAIGGIALALVALFFFLLALVYAIRHFKISYNQKELVVKKKLFHSFSSPWEKISKIEVEKAGDGPLPKAIIFKFGLVKGALIYAGQWLLFKILPLPFNPYLNFEFTSREGEKMELSLLKFNKVLPFLRFLTNELALSPDKLHLPREVLKELARLDAPPTDE